ncbi:MAG: hypothetical protein SGI73_11425 [Chloroflexota bacterium]|nr:hypothetical protein [Chloroflexota bacterium]
MLRTLTAFVILALALVGCDALPGSAPQPTALPYNLYTPQDAINAFTAAGLDALVPTREMNLSRGAPLTFNDRMIFQIAPVAPSGGQILAFDTPEAMAEWNTYIEQLRADSATRRDVSYVYTYGNILLQVNADLPPRTAQAYRDALAQMVY